MLVSIRDGEVSEITAKAWIKNSITYRAKSMPARMAKRTAIIVGCATTLDDGFVLDLICLVLDQMESAEVKTLNRKKVKEVLK
ncbi:MAG: hypothetical protein COB09_18700 [Thalassobium sp.]|nr:MAG: hypothetical protein COB09_18700 [Thalassobium sp.]